MSSPTPAPPAPAASPDRIRTREEWLEIYAGAPRSGHWAKPDLFWAGGEALVRRLKDGGAIRRGALALDLGCGPCKSPPHLVEREGMHIVGVDCNRDSVEFCRSLFPRERFEWIDVRNDTYNPTGKTEPDQVRLPVDDGACHLVICASFFTHVGTLKIAQHYIDEIRRVLAPGGYFLSSWFRNPPWELSSTDAMTVFKEAEIMNLLQPFTIITTSHGLVGGASRDQWNVLSRKDAR